MHERADAITFSASDLVGFLECPHRTALDLVDQETPLERAAPDEQVELMQDKGFAHEASYLDTLRTGGGRLVELSSAGGFAENLAATRLAMADGADIIFQAALASGVFMGFADFLRRVETPSTLGAWSYEVIDTKLAYRPKPKFMIQLAHYSELLTSAQGSRPQQMHLVFGNRTERGFRVADYAHYYRRFDTFLAERPSTAPEKCDACAYCDWRTRCAAEWETHAFIPLGARILSVANDYDGLQIGTLTEKRMSQEEARNMLSQMRGKRYDPQVVDAFIELIGGPLQELTSERTVSAFDLRSGMVLTRDFFGGDGVLLLAADYVLDSLLIKQIQDMDRREGGGVTLHVRADRR